MATKASTYFWTWVALVVLAVATYLLSRLDLGAARVPVALVIAVVKGLFVVLIFMHLLEQRPVNRVFFSIAFLFIVLLVALTTADVVTREPEPPLPERSSSSFSPPPSPSATPAPGRGTEARA